MVTVAVVVSCYHVSCVCFVKTSVQTVNAGERDLKMVIREYATLQGIVIWSNKDYRRTQTWSVTCARLLSRCVEDGTVFELRQGDVTLLVSVRRLPHFNLVEEVLDGKGSKFVLRMNSETSV